ncbi:MAG: hypothetical protein M1821_005656 [Bathelium mastoideum]|nr:MAG: hypothetical protein M1821_005656 [Bathelium mastoideum]
MEEISGNETSLEDEITLLKAMYPEELHYNTSNQELVYTSPTQAILKVRIPISYPISQNIPDIIFVTGPGPQKLDLRNRYRQALEEAHLVPGEPALDAMITTFSELVESVASSETQELAHVDRQASRSGNVDLDGTKFSTVIIWLHHLLATSKRKHALSPPSSKQGPVSGLTKPGYPGIMIFSGRATEVNEHVQALKGLNWQAFQVRYEDDQLWLFKHGDGMKELETMGEVVEEIGEERKEVFMEAMRMK